MERVPSTARARLAIATNGFSNFGLSHSTGTVTLAMAAQVHFAGGLALAQSLFGDTSANVTVKTGGHLNTGPLSIA